MNARRDTHIYVSNCMPYSLQMYRKISQGGVTYARGCKSPSSDVTSDTCDEPNEESCSTVRGTTVSTSYPHR